MGRLLVDGDCMGIFEDKNKKTFKIVLLVVMVVSIVGILVLTFPAQAQTISRTILFEDNTYIFDTDVNTDGTTNGTYFKSEVGFTVTDEDFTPLFDIFVSESPNLTMNSKIPETTNNALVIQRTAPPNAIFIDVVFWDTDFNRPSFVINGGTAGRASTFDRSLMVGKNFASGPLDLNYTSCEGTKLVDCDTTATGADLLVEDDIENFGSLQVHENAIIDGNLSFAGAFGEIFDTNVGTTVLITTKDVFVPVGGIQTGDSRNMLLNDTNVTVQIEGFYLVNYSFSFTNANNLEYEMGLMVNGIVEESGRANRKLQANDVGNMAGTAIVHLDVGDNVSMAIANTTNVADPIITNTTLTVTYIGN